MLYSGMYLRDSREEIIWWGRGCSRGARKAVTQWSEMLPHYLSHPHHKPYHTRTPCHLAVVSSNYWYSTQAARRRAKQHLSPTDGQTMQKLVHAHHNCAQVSFAMFCVGLLGCNGNKTLAVDQHSST